MKAPNGIFRIGLCQISLQTPINLDEARSHGELLEKL